MPSCLIGLRMKTNVQLKECVMEHIFEIRFCHDSSDPNSYVVVYEWSTTLEELISTVKESIADGFYGNVGYLHSIVQIDQVA